MALLTGASGGGGAQVRALTIGWQGEDWNFEFLESLARGECALSDAVVAMLAANRQQLRALAVHGG